MPEPKNLFRTQAADMALVDALKWQAMLIAWICEAQSDIARQSWQQDLAAVNARITELTEGTL